MMFDPKCVPAFRFVYSSTPSRFIADAFKMRSFSKLKTKLVDKEAEEPRGPPSPAAREERTKSPSL